MDGIEVYNNGQGWRIKITLDKTAHIVTRDQALELSNRLWKAVVKTIQIKQEAD